MVLAMLDSLIHRSSDDGRHNLGVWIALNSRLLADLGPLEITAFYRYPDCYQL
jgi:hypothetical protein